MPLRTVRVPAAVEQVFAEAEDVVSRFFATRRDDPEHGTIEIAGERYVLVRAAALSVEFFELVRGLYGAGRGAEADEFARNILFDLAHAVGRSDARMVHAKAGMTDPVARLSAGPVHFAHAGWAFVDIADESSPTPDADYYLLYDHPYSFEADAWQRAQRASTFPTCIMNAGYSSGWCEESFGLTLVATEVMCRARGDEVCRFVMAPPDRIEARVSAYLAGRPELATRVADYPIPDFFSRKRVEDDLRRRFEAELREREAAEARLRQAQKLEAVGRLAGGLAHDFNNYMAVIGVRTERLVRSIDTSDPMREELHQIGLAAHKASELTRQLLAFSRTQVLRPEELDLDRVIDDTMTLVAPLLGRGVRVVRERCAGGAWVSVDRSQMEQVLVNLVVNARDAMDGEGTLALECRAREQSGAWIELVVADDGCGMSAEAQARAFEPFFTTKSDRGGSGLGLATVYGIVTQSGGSVAIESEVDRGTRVVVMLPAARARAHAPAQDASTKRAWRVLLVDDDKLVRETLARLLRDAGLDVLVAPGPLEALALADAPGTELDLLLTDFVMPRMNGRALAERVRARRPDLPVLVMSGYVPDPHALDGLARTSFLTKPFRVDELLGAIDAAIGESGPRG